MERFAFELSPSPPFSLVESTGAERASRPHQLHISPLLVLLVRSHLYRDLRYTPTVLALTEQQAFRYTTFALSTTFNQRPR